MSVHAAPRPPVVVVGGFAVPGIALAGLVAGLGRAGWRARVWTRHLGMDCSEATVRALADDLAARCGPPPVLVGFSRGTHFCEVLARRRPWAVRGVVSLGGPSVRDGPLSGLNASLRSRILGLSRLHRRGLRGVVSPDCMDGACCERFWSEVDGTVPLPVPHRIAAATDDTVITRLNLPAGRVPDAMVPGGHASLIGLSATGREVLPRLVEEVATARPVRPGRA